MTTLSRILTICALLCGASGCTTYNLNPNYRVTLTQQYCQRHFGGDCPAATYRPPPGLTIPPPSGPVPDIHLTAISCDVEFGVNLVSAEVSNDGNADAAIDSNGNSVTVTVIATLRSGGGLEMMQNSAPGVLSAGASTPTIRIGPFSDWSRYSHISVSADSPLFNAERNYSNNDLQADVQLNPLPDSKFNDTIYCEQKG